MPCFKTTGAEDMAWLFVKNIYHHQEPPTIIVSDRGPQFISAFWDEFCYVVRIDGGPKLFMMLESLCNHKKETKYLVESIHFMEKALGLLDDDHPDRVDVQATQILSTGTFFSFIAPYPIPGL